jgi:hypothetical protein
MPQRERDVRNAIEAALAATGAFDQGGVWIYGLPEDYGSGASVFAGAAIEPVSSTPADRWDGGDGTGIVVASTVRITLLYRHDDPQVRDEACELLLDAAANALDGQSLAGFTAPDLTRLARWDWLAPTPPERRIAATFTFVYIVDGWQSYGTDP